MKGIEIVRDKELAKKSKDIGIARDIDIEIVTEMER